MVAATGRIVEQQRNTAIESGAQGDRHGDTKAHGHRLNTRGDR
jgi:hypothetical protein